MSPADLARLVALAALWGGSFAFIRVAAPVVGPLWLAESRVALAFVVLIMLALSRGRIPALRERWRDFLVIGIVNSALPFALFCFAGQYIAASTAAILNATSPFFGALAAALWLKDPLPLSKLAGMALGLAGVAGVVLLVGWRPEPITAYALAAVFACLAAAMSYGIASVYAKVRMAGVPSFSTALYSQLAAAIVLAPALPFAPMNVQITSIVAANIFALAVGSTAIAYLLYFRLIANIGPARALSVTFLIPLFGVLWGYLFLREPLSINMLLGGSLILGGTWLAMHGGTVASGSTRPRIAS
ncbi:MAG: DMT family transporter [Betaproteobacteria bacterium]|nr:MAG: DMT family transporter [Betaproteobacteria bacterium]